MNCKHCTQEVADPKSNFCPHCGWRLIPLALSKGSIILSCRLGEITDGPEKTDAIVTLLDPKGPKSWDDETNMAIKKVAGNLFHRQPTNLIHGGIKLKNKEAIYSDFNDREPIVNFFAVIFVVDYLVSPLYDLVMSALRCARNNDCRYLAFPVMRMEKTAGKVEKDLDAVLDQMKLAFINFRNPKYQMRVEIVTDDELVCQIIKDKFHDILQ